VKNENVPTAYSLGGGGGGFFPIFEKKNLKKNTPHFGFNLFG